MDLNQQTNFEDKPIIQNPAKTAMMAFSDTVYLYDGQNEMEILHSNHLPAKKIADNIFDMTTLTNLPSIPLTSDGGIIKFKQFVPEIDLFNHEPPSEGARVRIIYESRFENGKLTDKLRNIKEEKAFKLFSEDMINGISIAVESMVKGEISWFRIEPMYHYGPNGLPPVIPENTILYYKIQLVDYKNIKKNLNLAENFDQWEKNLKQLREAGEKAFQKKDYGKALREYLKGANIIKGCPKSFKAKLIVEELKKLSEHEINFLNNVCITLIKLNKFQDALKHANTLLLIDSKNVKGLFRRAMCYIEAKEFDLAKSDLSKCIELDPDNISVYNDKLREWRNKKQKWDEAEMKRYKMMFEKLIDEEEREKVNIKEEKNDNNQIFEEKSDINIMNIDKSNGNKHTSGDGKMEEEHINNDNNMKDDRLDETNAKNIDNLLLSMNQNEAEKGFYVDINKLIANNWHSDDEIQDENQETENN